MKTKAIGVLILLAAIGLFFSQPADGASLQTPVLVSPTNGAADTITGPILDWGNVTGATQYRVFVHENRSTLQAITATQTTCSGCRVNSVTQSSMFKFSYSDPLLPNRQYYWMVRAGSSSAGSLNSQIWSFKTGDIPILVTYQGGSSDYYIVKVRLDSGARIEPYLGTRLTSGIGTNCLGSGYSYYHFTEKNVRSFISGSTEIAGSRVVVSGSFHDDKGGPAFPQKVRGTIVTYGTDCTTDSRYQGKLRMIEIRSSDLRAFIGSFDLAKFKSTTIAPNVIVGLHPDFDKDADSSTTGRNFACVKDSSGGGYRTMIFLITDGMKSADAKGILLGKGCNDSLIIQFDGSSVAQLSEKVGSSWQHWITSFYREMPQVFAIFDPR